jgi:hypothetical protein
MAAFAESPLGMKRTSLWVPLAAAGVQLAALALCVWATQNARNAHMLAKPRPREALVPVETTPTVTVISGNAAATERPPVEVQAGASRQRERQIPRFITNFADPTTQVMAADAGEREIVFGIFSDGNIRCVDVDNGCYAGRAEGTRTRMREVAGSRAFTVQLEQADEDRVEATFVGGLHDAQCLVLVPLTGSGSA